MSTKGAVAEREVAKILSGLLGLEVKRALGASRDGGDDINMLAVSIEVKRREALSLGAWWKQTVKNAADQGKPPALFYRASRQPWRVVVRIDWLAPDMKSHVGDELATITPEAFAAVYRRAFTAPRPSSE